MNKKQRINYYQIPGLKLIPCYYLKEKRVQKHYTLTKAHEKLGFEGSYLNKMENGICEVPENILRILMHEYEIDFDQAFYCNFDREYVELCFDSICHSAFSEADYRQLQMKMIEHKESFYFIYLKLIEFGYKSFKQINDDIFLKDYKYLKRIIRHFDDRCRVFFYLFGLLYAARDFDHKDFDVWQRLLKKEDIGKWKIIEIYSNILMVFNNGKEYRILHLIEECKQELENFSNIKIYNSLVFFKALQYNSLHDYSEAIRLFKEYCQISIYNEDWVNYGIGMSSIASIYGDLKQYKKALECYRKAEPYIKYPDIYFDMAWSYYSLNEKDNCLKTIASGLKYCTEDDCWKLGLEWMEIMVTSPYSKRAKQKLRKIYGSFNSTLNDQAKSFFLIALINQARYDQNHEDIMIYTKDLIEFNIHSNITIEN